MNIIDQYIEESTNNDRCVLLTGVSGAGKTHISTKILKELNLKDVIELDEVMRQLVKKKHPKLKSFYKEDLIEYFGDMVKAKKVMWEHQLPALKESLNRYRKKPVLLEGMIVYYPQSVSLIESFTGEIYVIKPLSPNEFLNQRIKYSKMENYDLSNDQKKSIVSGYKKEVIGLRKFIEKYKDRIKIINN